MSWKRGPHDRVQALLLGVCRRCVRRESVLARPLAATRRDADLTKAAVDYQHHALSLILLGRFLAVARGGDIRQRDTVSFEQADSKRSAQTRSAWHVLETYEQWLQSAQGNLADWQALRLIGLFERCLLYTSDAADE